MDGATQDEFRGTERFSILRRLGEGGFGVVYEAWDRRRNARVALKALRRLDAAALYRFKQEFRSLADVSHPNLVSLYELLWEGDDWFFTMELIDGVSVLEHVRGESPAEAAGEQAPAPLDTPEDVTRSLIRAAGEGHQPAAGPAGVASAPQDLDRLREAFAQLATGVSALHEAGILHRDIKPSNVMVARDGRVVLLDFGLAAELASGEPGETGRILGTPAYMAPEQAAGLAAHEASDWYSVGTMLYQALTGHLPFTGSVYEVLRDKQKFEPPPPGGLVGGRLEELDTLCRDLLRTDPRQRPAGSEVLRRLGVAGVSGAGLRRAPLVGRERHLAALMEAFWASRQGRAVVAHVVGRSGMGKSVLVRRFLDDLRRREPRLVALVGRCYERESVPYKALDSLVDALTQYLKRLSEGELAGLLPSDVLALARLFPVLQELEAVSGAERGVLEIPDSQQLRRRAFAALRELLVRLGAQAPLALFIDDLQWGDADSGALLEEMLRPPDPPSLLLVVSFRSDEAESSPVLRRIRAGWAVESREIQVGELSAEEARQMVVALAGDSARADEIARESGGSPYFVQELAQFQETGAGTGTLDEALHLRVSRLPKAARRFLEVVAVAGRPLSIEIAKQAAEMAGDEMATLGVLRGGRLVRTRGAGELETYHDRIRETVVQHLPAPELRDHHRRLAGAWESAGSADPETLATHFQGAGETGRAAHYAVEAAGRAAQALAFDRAARLYRQALEWGAQGTLLRVRLAEALANAGRGGEAAREYLAAVPGAPAQDALEWSRRAAEQYLISGHVDEGMEALHAVLRMAGMELPGTPRKALLWLLARRAHLRLRGLRFRERPASQVPAEQLLRIDTCWSVAIGLALVDLIRGTEFQARHLLLALRAGEPYRVARALALEAGYTAVAGGASWPRTERLLRTTMALAERVGHPHAVGLATFNAGAAVQCNGRFREAVELCDRAEAILRERATGVAWEIDSSTIFGVHAISWRGDWNEVERRLPRLIRDAEERGDLYAASYWHTRQAYLLHLRDDEPERAREQERHGMALWSRRGFHFQHYYDLYARGEIDLYAGEAAAAWKRTSEAWPALRGSLILRLQLLRIEWLHLRARLALAVGQLEGAARYARDLEREKMPWSLALAGLIRASVAASRGRREQAAGLAASAEQACEAAGMAHYAAAARHRSSEWMKGAETADAWFAAQKVRNPARMVALLAPLPENGP